jgi:hypothetical protein
VLTTEGSGMVVKDDSNKDDNMKTTGRPTTATPANVIFEKKNL